MILSPRLKLISEKVIPHKKLADIGTDHAYLPSYLLLENIIDYAIASDVNKKPLLKAKETVTDNKIESLVSIRCGSGLQTLNKGEVEQIVIAGMGGELIIKILEEDLDKAHALQRLVLQPQSNSEKLRDFLQKNNFEILCEDIAVEGSGKKQYYQVLTVKPGQMRSLSENETKYGLFDRVVKDKNYKEFVLFNIDLLEKRIDSMKNSSNTVTLEKLKKYKEELNYLRDIYESI